MEQFRTVPSSTASLLRMRRQVRTLGQEFLCDIYLKI